MPLSTRKYKPPDWSNPRLVCPASAVMQERAWNPLCAPRRGGLREQNRIVVCSKLQCLGGRPGFQTSLIGGPGQPTPKVKRQHDPRAVCRLAISRAATHPHCATRSARCPWFRAGRLGRANKCPAIMAHSPHCPVRGDHNMALPSAQCPVEPDFGGPNRAGRHSSRNCTRTPAGTLIRHYNRRAGTAGAPLAGSAGTGRRSGSTRPFRGDDLCVPRIRHVAGPHVARRHFGGGRPDGRST
jgi:hypothetical protein